MVVLEREWATDPMLQPVLGVPLKNLRRAVVTLHPRRAGIATVKQKTVCAVAGQAKDAQNDNNETT